MSRKKNQCMVVSKHPSAMEYIFKMQQRNAYMDSMIKSSLGRYIRHCFIFAKVYDVSFTLVTEKTPCLTILIADRPAPTANVNF